MDKKYAVIVLVVVALLFYVGTTMFYNTGVGITDLNVEKTESNNYQVFYMLRAVRSFDYLDCEYSILTENNEEIGTGNTILTNIKDGTFNINETVNTTTNDTSKKASKIQIRIYLEKFNPEQKNNDGSFAQQTLFEQTSQIN